MVLVAVQLSVSGLYLAAGVENNGVLGSTPDNHFTAGPHCRVKVSGSRRVDDAGGCPTIGAQDCICRRYSKTLEPSDPPQTIISSASPDCRVIGSDRRRVGGAGGCPTIRARIVSPASVQRATGSPSTPDDHFTAGPDCRVIVSGSGRVGGAGGCPTIRAGIVSPAGVQRARCQYIHPRRSFHCRSTLPCDSLGQWARW